MEKLAATVKRHWLLILLALVLVALVGAYALGFRVAGMGLIQAGTLVVRNMPQGTLVFIDEAKRFSVSGKGEARIPLIPGSHTVIVAAPGYQPWNELFEVRKGEPLELSPILVPEEFSASLLAGEKKEEAMLAINAATLPSKKAPLPMNDGCVLVYVEGNRVLALPNETAPCAAPSYLACAPEGRDPAGSCPATVIFPASEKLASVIPFPGRADAIVVAAGSFSYVLELDPRDPRFVAPVARGSAKVAPATDSSLYMTNGTSYYEIEI